MDFRNCTLLISPRSPFARRVRLAFREHDMNYREQEFNVLQPAPELIAANPLARVPAAVLAEGTTIVDSQTILTLFYDGRQSEWFPRDARRIPCLQWSTLATGLCEKVVEYFLETLRPEDKRDPELLTELRDIVARVLDRAEAQLALSPTLVPGGLTQADLDFATTLGYLQLRYPADWFRRYPRCAEFFARMDERPSFAATRPPKA